MVRWIKWGVIAIVALVLTLWAGRAEAAPVGFPEKVLVELGRLGGLGTLGELELVWVDLGDASLFGEGRYEGGPAEQGHSLILLSTASQGGDTWRLQGVNPPGRPGTLLHSYSWDGEVWSRVSGVSSGYWQFVVPSVTPVVPEPAGVMSFFGLSCLLLRRWRRQGWSC